MDMSSYLKQNWQNEHAEEFTKGLLTKKDYAGLIDALAYHPFDGVRRAALKTIDQLDFTSLDFQIIESFERSIKTSLSKFKQILSFDFIDAANVLGKIKRPDGITYLIPLLEKDPYLKSGVGVQSAFDKCCVAVGEDGIDVLNTHLLEHRGCPLERDLIGALGSIGGERAYEALVQGLKNHCELIWPPFTWNWVTVDSYVYYLGRMGIKPETLDLLKVARDFVIKKDEERIARTDRVLLGTPQEPILIKKIEALIQKIQTESNL